MVYQIFFLALEKKLFAERQMVYRVYFWVIWKKALCRVPKKHSAKRLPNIFLDTWQRSLFAEFFLTLDTQQRQECQKKHSLKKISTQILKPKLNSNKKVFNYKVI